MSDFIATDAIGYNVINLKKVQNFVGDTKSAPFLGTGQDNPH